MLNVTTTATTAEQQLLHIASAIAEAEKALATPIDNVQISPNFEAGTVTIIATIPITLTVSGASTSFSATEYVI